ncbi:DUF4418 family protein [Bifidobacterium tissieri]|uniref:DUF4418 family protein n=1 Tax=Bifidobacterium tissieri TaxID=1630162 RepID=A0A5N0A0X4_9BIFI|nr:DUF4418 family protein [Bifidobacterium tissieri]KAA8830770.1 DUF4418 family protein [Bifidobacterium tissieri]KAA8832782.1 DUF4418 family protein [Bifidobacterium tissieri]
MKNKLFASIPSIVFGVLIAVAPQTFAYVCKVGEMPMACHWTAQAEIGVGSLIALLGVVALFVSPQIRIGLNIGVVLGAVLAIAIPTVLIGVCPGAMMHCHMVARPTLIVLGVLSIVFAAIGMWLDSRPAKRS